MIERLLYREGLPELYELRMHSESGKLKPMHERVVVMAETLDEREGSREETLMSAVIHKAQTEGIDDLDYSLRLMRPKEIRDHIRPRLRWALIRATEEQVMRTPPVKQLANLALEHVAAISGIVDTQIQTK